MNVFQSIYQYIYLPTYRDFTLITGDSTGSTTFWDGQAGVLIKNFKQHTADVQAVAVSPQEDAIFSSGIDHKIAMFQPTKTQVIDIDICRYIAISV